MYRIFRLPSLIVLEGLNLLPIVHMHGSSVDLYQPTPGAKTKAIHHLFRSKFNVRQMRHLTVSLRRSSPITRYNL